MNKFDGKKMKPTKTGSLLLEEVWRKMKKAGSKTHILSWMEVRTSTRDVRTMYAGEDM